jgi:hypothetical protein
MEVARANNGQWQPGRSGNPSGLPGRPLGSRAAFSQGFTRDLAEVWQAKGKQAMNWTADNQPAVFFATCARLLPNDVRVTVEQQLPGNLSMEDWQVMREVIAAVRQAIPDASSKPPGEVLEYVRARLSANPSEVRTRDINSLE